MRLRIVLQFNIRNINSNEICGPAIFCIYIFVFYRIFVVLNHVRNCYPNRQANTEYPKFSFHLIKDTMTEPQLTSLLEGITGHLQAATPEQEKALQQARQRIAASLVHSDDTGSEQLFANSDLYGREKISAASLDNIAAIAKQASQQQTDDGLRVYVRTVPVRSAQ